MVVSFLLVCLYLLPWRIWSKQNTKLRNSPVTWWMKFLSIRIFFIYFSHFPRMWTLLRSGQIRNSIMRIRGENLNCNTNSRDHRQSLKSPSGPRSTLFSPALDTVYFRRESHCWIQLWLTYRQISSTKLSKLWFIKTFSIINSPVERQKHLCLFLRLVFVFSFCERNFIFLSIS